VIWDPRFGFAEKCKKMLYLTFLIIKKLYPAFGAPLKTLNTPLLG